MLMSTVLRLKWPEIGRFRWAIILLDSVISVRYLKQSIRLYSLAWNNTGIIGSTKVKD